MTIQHHQAVGTDLGQYRRSELGSFTILSGGESWGDPGMFSSCDHPNWSGDPTRTVSNGRVLQAVCPPAKRAVEPEGHAKRG